MKYPLPYLNSYDPLEVARLFRRGHLALLRKFPWLNPKSPNNPYHIARQRSAQKVKLP